jgi:hypothetical protein
MSALTLFGPSEPHRQSPADLESMFKFPAFLAAPPPRLRNNDKLREEPGPAPRIKGKDGS